MFGLSRVWRSCKFTATAAAVKDKRQMIPKVGSYKVPDRETRLLRARLVLEEAFETVNALGFGILVKPDDREKVNVTMSCVELDSFKDFDSMDDEHLNFQLMEMIDGACDTIYVSTGLLAACGVPDKPHLEEVCRANDEKFPGGVAIIHPETGKYLKPDGWRGPDHEGIRDLYQNTDPQTL